VKFRTPFFPAELNLESVLLLLLPPLQSNRLPSFRALKFSRVTRAGWEGVGASGP
jgi:hypothetical protein